MRFEPLAQTQNRPCTTPLKMRHLHMPIKYEIRNSSQQQQEQQEQQEYVRTRTDYVQ